jgi:hypothetical protein
VLLLLLLLLLLAVQLGQAVLLLLWRQRERLQDVCCLVCGAAVEGLR